MEVRSFTQSKKEIIEYLKESRVVHTLVVKNVVSIDEGSCDEIPKEMKDVLDEFGEVILDYLPEVLSPF